MKKKTIYDMSLDELISVAYANSEGLNEALNRMLQVRMREQVTKPRNAEWLHRSLRKLADTVSRLSKVDYGESLAKEKERIEENDRRAEQLNALYKKPKTK